ncbi:MAG: FHA domain-containing protein [Bdellovibrionota bacterium]
MRIEIVMGHDGSPTYYQIERTELIIGSSTQCDVVLARPEISRRHLSLLIRGDTFFVIDHNSTNGTFLDEQKIEPGQKVAWETYTPMRLATGVIMTLVDDATDEASMIQGPQSMRSGADQTKTIVIPLAQLKAASKKPLPQPRKMKTEKKSNGMGMAYLIVAALIGAAYYLNVSKGIKFDFMSKKQLPQGNTVEGTEEILPITPN